MFLPRIHQLGLVPLQPPLPQPPEALLLLFSPLPLEPQQPLLRLILKLQQGLLETLAPQADLEQARLPASLSFSPVILVSLHSRFLSVYPQRSNLPFQ